MSQAQSFEILTDAFRRALFPRGVNDRVERNASCWDVVDALRLLDMHAGYGITRIADALTRTMPDVRQAELIGPGRNDFGCNHMPLILR